MNWTHNTVNRTCRCSARGNKTRPHTIGLQTRHQTDLYFDLSPKTASRALSPMSCLELVVSTQFRFPPFDFRYSCSVRCLLRKKSDSVWPVFTGTTCITYCCASWAFVRSITNIKIQEYFKYLVHVLYDWWLYININKMH